MQLKTIYKTFALVTALLFTVSMASATLVMASNDDATLQDGWFSVTYLGMTDNGDGTSTWSYQVEELGSGKGFKDLSHWVLGLGDCAEVISADPSGYEVTKDPRTGVYGIKWDVNDDFSSGEFSFTVDGVWAETSVDVATKAGRWTDVNSITGPSCDEDEGEDEYYE